MPSSSRDRPINDDNGTGTCAMQGLPAQEFAEPDAAITESIIHADPQGRHAVARPGPVSAHLPETSSTQVKRHLGTR